MSEKYIAPDTTTNEWNSYPFEVNGVNFVSKIRKGSSFDKRAQLVSSDMFAHANRSCIISLIGNPSLMTRHEIVESLAHVNRGGTQAILELA